MKYKSIFKLCLLTTFLSVATISCDDWTEMEIHDSQVNGFKEQNPQEYAAYTQNLRAYKATKHAVAKKGKFWFFFYLIHTISFKRPRYLTQTLKQI